MSGGPYGRGKAPRRACMKLADWPQADQVLWKAALTPADPFTGSGGSRAGHRPISNRNIERGYGRWLTFLRCKGQTYLKVHRPFLLAAAAVGWRL
jgi:hypothetical protein